MIKQTLQKSSFSTAEEAGNEVDGDSIWIRKNHALFSAAHTCILLERSGFGKEERGVGENTPLYRPGGERREPPGLRTLNA